MSGHLEFVHPRVRALQQNVQSSKRGFNSGLQKKGLVIPKKDRFKAKRFYACKKGLAISTKDQSKVLYFLPFRFCISWTVLRWLSWKRDPCFFTWTVFQVLYPKSLLYHLQIEIYLEFPFCFTCSMFGMFRVCVLTRHLLCKCISLV